MSGECQICHDHCLDCKCGIQNLGCDPPGTMIDCVPCPPPQGMEIKITGDKGYATHLNKDGTIQLRSVSDKVNHPHHYQGNTFEVIDVIEDFGLGFSLGNAIKYILRAGKKGDRIEDLKKAIWYIEREISTDQ